MTKRTSEFEVYRMLGIVGSIEMTPRARDDVRELLGDKKWYNIVESAINGFYTNLPTALYEHFLNKQDYDSLKKYFEINYGFSSNQTITIFDPFANQGRWLKMFGEEIPSCEWDSAKIHLIANEEQQEGYNHIVNKGIVQECYNKPYEALNEVPKQSISLLLYNPPQGDTDGVDNAYHYLQMIIDDEVIYSSPERDGSGRLIMVAEKERVLNTFPLLVKYFKVDLEWIYRTDNEDKFVVYATLRGQPLDLEKDKDGFIYQEEVETLESVIETNPEFKPSMYNNLSQPPSVPYERMKENHKIVQEEDNEVSVTGGDSWNWLREMTEIGQVEHEEINKATPLKIGELSNLIASGMINGEMLLEDGEGYHIVAGGMKEQWKQEVIQEENRQGELENKTKTLVYSQPYLNILINDNGKIKIKELEGGSELE